MPTRVLAALLLGAASAAADPLPATVRNCYDGDTCRVDLSLTLPPVFGTNLPVRLAAWDTAELRGTAGACKALAIRARDRLRELIVGRRVELVGCERGKYFRLVCSIRLGDRDVGEVLAAERLAVPYGGDPCTLAEATS